VTIVLVVLIRGDGQEDASNDDDNDYDDGTRLVAPVDGFRHIVTFGVGCMDIIFAFSGQVFFIELLSSMPEPSTFKKSVALSTMVMTGTYVAVSATAYLYIGASGLIGGEPITSSLDESFAKSVVNAFLAVHVVVAYVIEVNVLARGFLKVLGRKEATTGQSYGDMSNWFCATAAIVFAAFFISNVVPFFSDIMGLLGSMCSVLLTYTIPIVCARKLVPMADLERRLTEMGVYLSLIVAFFGTICSVVDIADRLAKDASSKPFSCGA
jgi:hypothetical protein